MGSGNVQKIIELIESAVGRNEGCYTSLRQAAGRASCSFAKERRLVAVDLRAERGVGGSPNVNRFVHPVRDA